MPCSYRGSAGGCGRAETLPFAKCACGRDTRRMRDVESIDDEHIRGPGRCPGLVYIGPSALSIGAGRGPRPFHPNEQRSSLGWNCLGWYMSRRWRLAAMVVELTAKNERTHEKCTHSWAPRGGAPFQDGDFILVPQPSADVFFSTLYPLPSTLYPLPPALYPLPPAFMQV